MPITYTVNITNLGSHTCPSCTIGLTIRNTPTIVTPPRVLVLQLKRFEHIYPGVAPRRINHHVYVNPTLDIKRMCSAGTSSFVNPRKPATLTYTLTAVVRHAAELGCTRLYPSERTPRPHRMGDFTGGHYIADVRDPTGR